MLSLLQKITKQHLLISLIIVVPKAENLYKAVFSGNIKIGMFSVP